ncbi:MAG: hypothetical protein U1F77_10670 [Kiritimatiellia bacterium]
MMEGDAGGLEANVRRWMKQIRLDPSDEAKVRDFLQGLKPEKTTGGFGCVLVDFAPCSDRRGTAPNPCWWGRSVSPAGPRS